MAQTTQTILLQGGLNLVTPPVAVLPGQATAALNYEADAQGYRRMDGYERFDGRPSPSDGANTSEIATRRAAIGAVPGAGQVRGVWVYDGAVYAFRDTVGGSGRMYKSSAAGWVEQTFGYELSFTAGTAEFAEGETLVGGTSGATARIDRVVLSSGAWSGTAAGYLVISSKVGAFGAETVTSTSGSATIAADASPIALSDGGTYECITHNFYGAASRARMYFANGVGTAFEWDGRVLAPIRTGNDAGSLDAVTRILTRAGDRIITRAGAVVIARGEHDKPVHVGAFRNHLFLSFDAGSLIHSALGEPLDYRAIAGAGEIAIGSAITGFLPSAASSFVVFGQGRVEYITGNDSSDFAMVPITDGAGAYPYTAQMAGDRPVYLDDAGLRSLSTTAAFGDWRMGTLTAPIAPLFRAKRTAGVRAANSIRVKQKDQYRLFWDDQSGISLYLGRKLPEPMPFRLPIQVTCACAAEVTAGEGDRLFVGAEDGYVYELDKGTSFDGAAIEAYLRLAWNDVNAPSLNKRFHKVLVETDAEDAMTIGVTFQVDYGMPGNPGGVEQNVAVAAGTQSTPGTLPYADVDWTQPSQGQVARHIGGFGRNLAVTLISEHTTERPHAFTALTTNYSLRGLRR